MVKSIAEAGSYHVTTIPPWPVGPRVSKVHPKASSTDVEMHPSKAAFVNGLKGPAAGHSLRLYGNNTDLYIVYIPISTPIKFISSSCKFPNPKTHIISTKWMIPETRHSLSPHLQIEKTHPAIVVDHISGTVPAFVLQTWFAMQNTHTRRQQRLQI